MSETLAAIDVTRHSQSKLRFGFSNTNAEHSGNTSRFLLCYMFHFHRIHTSFFVTNTAGTIQVTNYYKNSLSCQSPCFSLHNRIAVAHKILWQGMFCLQKIVLSKTSLQIACSSAVSFQVRNENSQKTYTHIYIFYWTLYEICFKKFLSIPKYFLAQSQITKKMFSLLQQIISIFLGHGKQYLFPSTLRYLVLIKKREIHSTFQIFLDGTQKN